MSIPPLSRPRPPALAARRGQAARASVLAGAGFVLAAMLVLAPSGGCGDATGGGSDVSCTPGKSVLCRCQDVESSGEKPCSDDGRSFGACSCATTENPEVPEKPGQRPIEVDASADAELPSQCGDKVVQDSEDCDDGNKVEDDGCNSACKLAGPNPASTRSCPGLDTHVWSKPVTYVGTTAGAPLTGSLKPKACQTGSGTATTGASSADRVFKVTAHKSGTMTVTTSDAAYDSLLYVTKACATDGVAYVSCANSNSGTGGEKMSFPVKAGAIYSVFVDGAGVSQQGAFRVTFAIR